MSSALKSKTSPEPNSTILATHSLDYHAHVLLDTFAPLSHQPWAMLLHSASCVHIHSRFDILVADPIATLTTQGEITYLNTPDGTKSSLDEPLSLLQDMIESHLPQLPTCEHFPFQGGALGMFSYDLGRRFEQLPRISEQDISSPDMAVGLYDWALIADHQQQTLTLICLNDIEKRLQWLEENLLSAKPSIPFKLEAHWRANISRASYGEKFETIQRYLQSGDCYQINLTQRFQAPYSGDEWLAFVALTHANSAPFSAFIRLPESTILSVSPERFILLQDGQVQTRPIKGTRPRYSDPKRDKQEAEALASSLKDKAENLMIVDLLRNDIGRIAEPGSVKVPELFAVEPFPAVHHLVSTVTAKLPPTKNATDLLRACFPGGSITGAPKIRAMEIIEELEPQRRNIYCGSIGYISCCGNMDTSITIRTLLAEKGKIYCWAGGGIVADSEVDAEYKETLDKVSRILPQLGEFIVE